MLQKSYLKYELKDTFGVIAAVDSDVCFFEKKVLAGGLERVLSWSYGSGERRESFFEPFEGPEKALVCRLEPSPDGESFAVGFTNGSVQVWGRGEGGVRAVRATFSGHSRPVTAMAFSEDGQLLATGSQSTEVIVWDVLGESGRARFKGHKGAVTSLCFAEGGKKLISASKDTMVLVWDLTLQTCVQTLAGHRHEVWSIALDPVSRTRLITGSADNKLRVWRQNPESKEFEFYGAVERSTESRVAVIGFVNETRFVVQNVGKLVEVYEFGDAANIKKKMKRRLRREKSKMEAKEEALKSNIGVPGFNYETELASLQQRYVVQPRASDEISLAYTFTVSHKLHRMAVGKNRVALLSNRNEFQVFKIGSKEAKEQTAVSLPGHRSDVRALCLNSNDAQMFTVSQNVGKLWNAETTACISTTTLEGNGLCAAFVPLDKYVVVGTKEGRLEIVAPSIGTVVESVAAHDAAVWDVAMMPDKKGLVSCSADKSVKFWDFAVRKNSASGESNLTLNASRTLAMTDDCLSLCFSADGKFLAVSLLDSTVKVYYCDSLNLYLTLYGHKLPVLSISISSDSKLLISGSADKNVKIWGLDFGDCHRSLFAHDDSVTRVAFVPNTHYFVSASKDGTIKYWDADRFNHVTTLRGHASEVWCLAVSSVGDYLATGSHDRSIRIWGQTEELLFPEQEKQKELDLLFAPSVHELQLATNSDKAELEITEQGIQGLTDGVSSAGLQTASSAKHAERLFEAVQLAYDERAKYLDWKSACQVAERELSASDQRKRDRSEPLLPPPDKNPLLLNLSPEAYLKLMIGRIPLSELDQCLSLLTFGAAVHLLHFCEIWLGDSSSNAETVCRMVCFLLRLHIRQISQAKHLVPLLSRVQKLTRARLEQARHCMTFNLAAATHLLARSQTDADASELFEAAKLVKETQAKRRKKESTRKIIY